jgi:hypothetical protein
LSWFETDVRKLIGAGKEFQKGRCSVHRNKEGVHRMYVGKLEVEGITFDAVEGRNVENTCIKSDENVSIKSEICNWK